MFSVLCRSGNAAGMLAVGLLIVILLSTETFEDTSYYLFLKPFDPPSDLDTSLWVNRVVLNRAGIAILGILFIFLALRRMIEREKLL